MSNKPTPLTNELYNYVIREGVRETPIQEKCRMETARLEDHNMQISPDQGSFMAFLVRLIGAKKTLEVGVFTGYSSLWIAGALPAGGKHVACDVSVEWTDRARAYWDEAGLSGGIDLRIGPGSQTLERLIESGESGTFDFIFIDADKETSVTYYELSFELLRNGGVVVFDNAFWDGHVADVSQCDPETDAIRSLLFTAREDSRVDMSLVNIADGLLLVHKL